MPVAGHKKSRARGPAGKEGTGSRSEAALATLAAVATAEAAAITAAKTAAIAAAKSTAVATAAEPVTPTEAVTAAHEGIEVVFAEPVPLVATPAATSSVKTHKPERTLHFALSYTVRRRGRIAPDDRANARKALSSALCLIADKLHNSEQIQNRDAGWHSSGLKV